MGEITLNPPKQRRCVICGREDEWNEDLNEWTIRERDGHKRTGNRFCLHEWDITGSHTPIQG